MTYPKANSGVNPSDEKTLLAIMRADCRVLRNRAASKVDDVDDADIAAGLNAAARKNAIRKFSSAVPPAISRRESHG